MILVTAGDSFTYGDELPNRIDDCWPSKLSKLLNSTQLTNLGIPGASNTCIVRTILDYISSEPPPDLIVIGWSSPGRIEYADTEGPFDIWPGSNRPYEEDDSRRQLAHYVNNHHNSEYLYHQYLSNVILLQSFLTARNIKYLMMTTVANEFYHKTYYRKLPLLTALIDPTYFVGWPIQGMAEWTYGVPKGPGGHFLEEGHTKVAEKINEHIRHLGWVS